jgi:hypothetical protein
LSPPRSVRPWYGCACILSAAPSHTHAAETHDLPVIEPVEVEERDDMPAGVAAGHRVRAGVERGRARRERGEFARDARCARKLVHEAGAVRKSGRINACAVDRERSGDGGKDILCVADLVCALASNESDACWDIHRRCREHCTARRSRLSERHISARHMSVRSQGLTVSTVGTHRGLTVHDHDVARVDDEAVARGHARDRLLRLRRRARAVERDNEGVRDCIVKVPADVHERPAVVRKRQVVVARPVERPGRRRRRRRCGGD